MAWTSSNRRQRLPSNWTQIQQSVLADARYVCQIRGPRCLRRASQADHIRPGDDHSKSNLQAVCERCHAHKSALEGNAAKARKRALRRRPEPRHPGTR